MKVKDKTILVTGSTGGIGSALCSLLAKRGTRLILTCYDEELLARLKAKLGSKHTTVTADLSSTQGRKEIAIACERNGGIDAVINLAGILDFNLFEKQSQETIEKILSINLVSVMLLCHELIPMLREKSTATIVNVGSTFGSIGHPGFAAYCASKAGVRCFTEALSRELADSDIHVSYIAPRATSTSLNTDQINALNTALGNKSDSPEYVANQIVEVIERDARLRFLGWPEKLFVRVNALFPGLVHGALVKKLSVIKQYANQ